MKDRLLSVEQFSDRIGCSVRTVRRWIANGVLPSVKLGGLRRVRESALERLFGSERTDWESLVDLAPKFYPVLSSF